MTGGSDLDGDGRPDVLTAVAQRGVEVYTDLRPVPTDIASGFEDLQVNAAGSVISVTWRLSSEAQREAAALHVERAEALGGAFIGRTPAALEPSVMSFLDSEIEVGKTYWYRLRLVALDGTESFAGPVPATAGSAWSTLLHVPQESGDGGPITIRYQIGSGTPAALEIFDVRGRRVRSLVREAKRPGPHSCAWDRRDDHGTLVGRGVYIVSLRAGAARLTHKLVLFREPR